MDEIHKQLDTRRVETSVQVKFNLSSRFNGAFNLG